MRLTLFVLMSRLPRTIAAGNAIDPDAGAGHRTARRSPRLRPAQEPRRRREVSPEERAKIEAALPAKAPALPKKPRKLLVFDRQGIYLGRQYGGHSSIPHANLAVQLMGEKTAAFTATLASEPDAISSANLQQYDAVYLNNTVGDVFDTPEMRAAFAAFVANGGGVVGNHGTSVASPTWTAFADILGATGASHREPTEKATINIEDPAHPITRVFDGKPFEYTDEFYRLGAPYSRDKVRVLLSIDPIVDRHDAGALLRPVPARRQRLSGRLDSSVTARHTSSTPALAITLTCSGTRGCWRCSWPASSMRSAISRPIRPHVRAAVAGSTRRWRR